MYSRLPKSRCQKSELVVVRISDVFCRPKSGRHNPDAFLCYKVLLKEPKIWISDASLSGFLIMTEIQSICKPDRSGLFEIWTSLDFGVLLFKKSTLLQFNFQALTNLVNIWSTDSRGLSNIRRIVFTNRRQSEVRGRLAAVERCCWRSCCRPA